MVQTVLSILAVLAAASYASFLLLGKERSFPSVVLACVMAATGALEIFDLLAVLHPEEVIFWKKFSLTAEGLLVPLWVLFSFNFAREMQVVKISFPQRFISWSSWIFPVAALALTTVKPFYSPDFADERILFLAGPAFLFYTGMLLYLVIALVNLETTLANSSHGWRWRIKFEIIGAMFILAVLLFHFSQGFLYRTLDMNLLPLRSVVVAAGVGIMAYSRLKRGGGARIYVSRGMAFRSVVILAVGVYLIGVGLIGEGMKYFGEAIHRSIAMGASFLVGLGLVMILLSERARRKIKVFLQRNFYRHKYDYKTQWLQFTRRLSSSRSGDELLTAIVSGFCDIFGMGCGALFLRDGNRGVYYNAAALEMSWGGLLFDERDSLPVLLSTRRSVVDLEGKDVQQAVGEIEFLKNNSIRFLVPLNQGDSLLGFVALGRVLNKDESFNEEDHDLMDTLAQQAGSAVLNLRLSDELSGAREVEAMGKLAAFVMHDLKNVVTSTSLMVENAQHYMHLPEFQADLKENLKDAVVEMNSLILKLKKLREKGSCNRQPADLLEIAASVGRQIGHEDVKVSGAQAFSEVDVTEIDRLLMNLVLNALEANGGEGPVFVEVGCSGQPFIRVTDNGCGMSEDFLRNELFKPFATTKDKGFGIGLYQCRQIAECNGGRIEVKSKVGTGSTFTVWLPNAAATPLHEGEGGA